MAKNWTREQLDAIEYFGTNMIISASAGSGKTSTVIQKVINLVLNDVPVDKIVMLTFSKNAAREMKDKLVSSLSETLENETDVEKRMKLREQLENVDFCDISTIHSFCTKLIKQHFSVISLDPSFTVLDENEGKEYVNRAMENVLDRYTANGDKDFVTLYLTMLNNRKDELLNQSILSLHEYFAVMTDEKYFVDEIALSGYVEDITGTEIERLLLEDINETFIDFKEPIEDILLRATDEKIIMIATLMLTMVNELTSAKNIYLLAASMIGAQLPSLSGKFADVGLKEEFKTVKSEFSAAFKEYVSIFENIRTLSKENADGLSIAKKLVEVAIEYKNEYLRIKKEERLLDFSDLEYYAMQILANEDIAKTVAEEFDFLIIDEYQDTNYVQEYIISKITRQNCFMVGDVKQSIYRFRMTEPEIFINKYKLFKEEKTLGYAVDFNKNFRSNKVILDFINSIFDVIMTDKNGGVDYEHTARLYTDIDYATDITLANVKMLLVDKGYQKESTDEETDDGEILGNSCVYSVKDDENYVSNESVIAESEAKIIALKIDEMIESKYIYDRDHVGDTITRKIKYSDITILSRNAGGVAQKVVNILKSKYNLPLNLNNFGKGNDGYDVRCFIEYLKLLINDKQDVPLIGIMTGAYGKFSLEELARIKIETRYSDCMYFHERVEVYMNLVENNPQDNNEKVYREDAKVIFDSQSSVVNGKDDEDNSANKIIIDKLKAFYKKLAADRYFCANHNVYELAKRYYVEADFDAYLLNATDAKDRQTAFNNYKESLNGKSYADNIIDYVTYFENYRKKREYSAYDSLSGEQINVTTIHKSKGLEYQIVFLIGTETSFNMRTYSDSHSVLIDKTLGVGLSYYDKAKKKVSKTLLQKAIEIKLKKVDIEEEMRVLYVALTRAKKHLFVVGACDGIKFGTQKNIVAKSFLDWFGKAVAVNPELEKYIQFYPKAESDERDEKGKFDFTPMPPDLEKTEKLETVFEYKYPYADSVKLATKYTVTEIMKLDNEREREWYINNYELSADKNGAIVADGETRITLMESPDIRRGVVYHKILEKIDFNFTSEVEISDFLTLMIADGTFTDEDISLIDIKKIQNCLSGDIFEYARKCGDYQREVPFLLNVQANELFELDSTDFVTVQGVIDLVIFGEKIIVVDYKSSSRAVSGIKKTYAKQLELYKKAIERIYNVKVDEKIIFLINSAEKIILD